MSCCAADTNGCLDLRHRASALDGRVRAEWSRCLGCTARCAIDSVCDEAQQVGCLQGLEGCPLV